MTQALLIRTPSRRTEALRRFEGLVKLLLVSKPYRCKGQRRGYRSKGATTDRSSVCLEFYYVMPACPANKGARGLQRYGLAKVGSILRLKCIPSLQKAGVPVWGTVEMSAAVICNTGRFERLRRLECRGFLQGIVWLWQMELRIRKGTKMPKPLDAQVLSASHKMQFVLTLYTICIRRCSQMGLSALTRLGYNFLISLDKTMDHCRMHQVDVAL